MIDTLLSRRNDTSICNESDEINKWKVSVWQDFISFRRSNARRVVVRSIHEFKIRDVPYVQLPQCQFPAESHHSFPSRHRYPSGLHGCFERVVFRVEVSAFWTNVSTTKMNANMVQSTNGHLKRWSRNVITLSVLEAVIKMWARTVRNLTTQKAIATPLSVQSLSFVKFWVAIGKFDVSGYINMFARP